MAPTRCSLGSFLATAARVLSAPSAQRTSPVTLVIGNESADLDSICTALMYAYLRTHTAPYTLHIPLSNLMRDDLRLRPELDAVLGQAGLEGSHLLTLSDLPNLEPDQTRWFLVDHNALSGQLRQRYANRVVGCIDHHEDEGEVPQATGSEPRIIERSGSCMSLVLKYFQKTWDDVRDMDAEDKSAVDCNFELGRLALGPILVDTWALTDPRKTTTGDSQAAEMAEKYVRIKHLTEISRLKEDISTMPYRDIFRRDYKQWTEGGLNVGISVVPQSFEYMLAKIGGKDEMMEALGKWAEEKRLDMAVIMTTARPDGKFTRELCVWAFNKDAIEAVMSFTGDNQEKLGLAVWHEGFLDQSGPDCGYRACWTQADVGSSRKQVGPRLREAIKICKS